MMGLDGRFWMGGGGKVGRGLRGSLSFGRLASAFGGHRHLLVALACGWLAILLLEAGDREPRTARAWAAARPIPAWTPLTERDVVGVEFPLVSGLPALARGREEVIGRVATSPLLPGEPLLLDRLADPAAVHPSLPFGPDLLTLSLPLDPLADPAAHLRVGQRVDLLALAGGEGGWGGWVERSIPVVGLVGEDGRPLGGPGGEGGREGIPGAALLAVTSGQAERIARALQGGSLRVLLAAGGGAR